MNCPISQILAKIKLRILKNQIRRKYERKIKLQFRYVDGVIVPDIRFDQCLMVKFNEKAETGKILEEHNMEDKNV